MIDQIKGYGLNDPKVFAVMRKVRRENFVPTKLRSIAYEDKPIDIGFGQTISQPYTVAFMTSLLSLEGDEKVLEIGTGSGYQAAILSHLAKRVYSVELIPSLAKLAAYNLKKEKCNNVEVIAGSGEWGWKEKAPFERIIITAGLKKVPSILFEQLKLGGILVVPIGEGKDKVMTRFTKMPFGVHRREKFSVFHFVPFVKESN